MPVGGQPRASPGHDSGPASPTRSVAPWESGLLLLLLSGALAGRLLAITQPYDDAWSWRQADVAMIARNFYENGFSILYPQIDWAGPAPGYIGSEFPLVPFIAALFYTALGVQDWIGRGVSAAAFLPSLPFYYLLVRRAWGPLAAFAATLVYAAAPLTLFSSRSFMPDAASLSFSVIGLCLFSEWTERPKARTLLAAAAVTALAILIKAPAVIIGLPYLYLAAARGKPRGLCSRELWAFAALTLIPPLAWYGHALAVAQSNPPHHLFGEGGIRLVAPASYAQIAMRSAGSSLTILVALLAAVGLLWTARDSRGRVFQWWLAAIVLFIVAVGNGNQRHAWYQLPLVPVAAAFAGVACSRLLSLVSKKTNSNLLTVSLGSLVVASFIWLSYDQVKPLYEPWAAPWVEAGLAVKELTPEDALIVVPGIGDPTTFYYGHRRGWHFTGSVFGGFPTDSAQAIADLEQRRSEGADYLVFTRYTAGWLDTYQAFGEHVSQRYRLLQSTDQYRIYDLRAEQ